MLRLPDISELTRLRELLHGAGYTRDGIREVIHTNQVPSVRERNLPLLLDLTRPISLRHTLIRLFHVGAPITAEEAGRWIPDWAIRLCLEAGVLTEQDGGIAPLVSILPFEGLLVAADPALKIAGDSPTDVVLGVNTSTWLLHEFTVRRKSRATLDLGAGSGPLALAAAAHSETVTATDINRRATEFARFNARLNGCENIEHLNGDTFDPVAGRRFDLIIANPPFFISPKPRHLYCDNPMELDQYCRRVVREGVTHLEDGGYLQLLCEWAEVVDQRWEERLAEWLDGTGCSAWILKFQSHDPSTYAQNRIRDTTTGSEEADRTNYDEWMAYYRRHGVTGIHNGLMAIRRGGTNPWIRFDELRGGFGKSVGDLVERVFANQDHLNSANDESLLKCRVRIAPEIDLRQSCNHAGGRWNTVQFELLRMDGLPGSQRLDLQVMRFVSSLDGEFSLGESIARFAAAVGLEPERVRPECIQVARRLIGQGYLLP